MKNGTHYRGRQPYGLFAGRSEPCCTTVTKFGLAQPVRRMEDPACRGVKGRYVDDFASSAMLHAAVLRPLHRGAYHLD